MLKALTLRDWKSFGETRNRIPLAPLTLLVGPNASGKSNALDALRFLHGIAFDYPLGEVLRGRWEGQREVWAPIRGQLVEAARGSLTRFELRAEWRIEGSSPGLSRALDHRIEIDTREDAALDAEQIMNVSHDDDYAFSTHADALQTQVGRQVGGGIRAALRSRGKGNSETRIYSAARSLLGQVNGGGRIHPTALEDAKSIRDALRRIVFLDIQPSRMRDYKPVHASNLGTSGENVSPKLKSIDVSRRADIVAWLSELCAPRIREISFEITQLKEVMFFLEEGADIKISARSVSDGTLRFLGLVTALLTADPGSLIVLEEPDVGLHPARIHLLARLLEQRTSNGDVQILATTHSPTLLAHLSEGSLANVVALGRDDLGTSVAQRLGDVEHFSTLRDSQRLDHLVTTGWIERAL